MYYSLVVANFPVLFPNASYVKIGDTIIRKEIRDDVDGRPFEFQPVARGPDITDDGAVYWVSFENENLRVTTAMGELVLGFLDPASALQALHGRRKGSQRAPGASH